MLQKQQNKKNGSNYIIIGFIIFLMTFPYSLFILLFFVLFAFKFGVKLDSIFKFLGINKVEDKKKNYKKSTINKNNNSKYLLESKNSKINTVNKKQENNKPYKNNNIKNKYNFNNGKSIWDDYESVLTKMNKK